MKFDAVTIKNFRNFENITIDLTNKNVLFGMNDVGKTNFLYALRFLFDKDVRRQNFIDLRHRLPVLDHNAHEAQTFFRHPGRPLCSMLHK